jgi:hypothetical protein
MMDEPTTMLSSQMIDVIIDSNVCDGVVWPRF